jgi:membrane-bound ClpP family serine protease
VDWTIVVSTAITGVVGVAGVAGTVIAARIAGKSAMDSVKFSISAGDRRAWLNYKRQVYVEGMTAFHNAVVLWKTAKDPERDHPDDASLAAARREAGSRRTR